MDEEILVEVKIKYPKHEDGREGEEKTGMFKMPFDMEGEGNLMIDLVAFGELVKSFVVSNISEFVED